jgi:hypothetical protein
VETQDLRFASFRVFFFRVDRRGLGADAENPARSFRARDLSGSTARAYEAVCSWACSPATVSHVASYRLSAITVGVADLQELHMVLGLCVVRGQPGEQSEASSDISSYSKGHVRFLAYWLRAYAQGDPVRSHGRFSCRA